MIHRVIEVSLRVAVGGRGRGRGWGCTLRCTSYCPSNQGALVMSHGARTGLLKAVPFDTCCSLLASLCDSVINDAIAIDCFFGENIEFN